MINTTQFRDLIKRTLRMMDETDRGIYSVNAICLLEGTAAQESKFGTYLKQLGLGYALGFFQMEEPTFSWLKSKYWKFNLGEFEEQEYNIKNMIMACRLRYRAVTEPLPDYRDLTGMARYWKKYYNTELGKGTEKEFIKNFKRYVFC
jgi:hypothetical protein